MVLLKLLEDREISKLQLALNCKITPSDLYRAIKGKKPFYPKWRKNISKYLNVEESFLFNGKELKRLNEENNK